MNAVLIIELQPWTQENHYDWVRYGTWSIFFTKNDKFSLNEYMKTKDDVLGKTLLSGTMWEYSDAENQKLTYGFSMPVNPKKTFSTKNFMDSSQYSLRWETHYKASVNEILERLHSSFSVNKVMKIEKD
jgi:hypothetical protein